MSKPVEPPLLVCWVITAKVCPRKIRTVAVRPDHVGVEDNELTLFDDFITAFLIPRIRARSRGEKPGLDPLTAMGDVGFMQDRPIGKLLCNFPIARS